MATTALRVPLQARVHPPHRGRRDGCRRTRCRL